MSSNLIKIIAGVFIVLAAILGFFAWQMAHNYADTSNRASQAQQNQAAAIAAAPLTQVVVAIKPLPANQPIDRGSLKVIGLEVVPSQYFTSLDDVAGLTPLIDIDTGTPITPQLLKGNPVAKQIPAGFKAVSLTLTDVIGVGGFVRPGDIVDVLVYLRNDQQNKVDPAQARILQKDALVLAFDDHVINPPVVTDKSQNGQQQQQQPQRRERTVVVAVPDAEVTRVMLGASLGEVRLALHGQAQDQVPATQPAADASSSSSSGGTAVAAAAAPAAPAASAGGAALPTPVSGASLPPPQVAATAAAPGKTDAQSDLPDLPYTSADLAKLKPKHAAKGAPQGIVIYRGTAKASTVYP